MRSRPHDGGLNCVVVALTTPSSITYSTRGSLLRAVAAASGSRTEKPLMACS
jgi:hypothetical protein